MSRVPFSHQIVDGTLRTARIPLDLTVSLLPDGPQGPGAGLKLAVDDVDAAIRSTAGRLLGDERLREEADRIHRATEERRRARDLNGMAENRFDAAENDLEQHREAAERRRREADKAAANRDQGADRRRQERREGASNAAERREHDAEKEAERRREAAERRANVERLRAAEERGEALDKREQAGEIRDAARDLGDAADAAKTVRKSS